MLIGGGGGPRQIMFLGCSALHFIIANMAAMERRRASHMSQVLDNTQLRRGSTSMKRAHVQHVNSTCSDRMLYTFLHKREVKHQPKQPRSAACGCWVGPSPPHPATLAPSARRT
jgi:hypothetical protein